MRINNINNVILPKRTKPLSFKSNKEEEAKVLQYKLPPSYAISSLYTANTNTARLQPRMDDFFDFLEGINLSKKSLLSQIKDFSFAFNTNFDVDGWKNFLTEMNSSIAIIEEDDEKEKAITFLQQLSTIYYIPDLINNPKFNPNKAIEFLDELYDKPDEEISKIPFAAQIDFMADAGFSKKDLKEYISDLYYFIDLEDNNGDKILSERYGEMDRMQADVIKHMLNVDNSSVEASNTQMLIELVQNGVVDKHVFDYMPTNGKINSFIVEDIDKLYNAYINGIKPIDAFVPTYKNSEEAQSTLNIGDVYEVKDTQNIFILDRNKQPKQLGIDKETYFELFPPIERYATTQNDIGNCWEITGFNTLLTDPKERESLLSLFTQDGDDIIVSFPSQNIKEVRFKGGELPSSTDPNYTSKGAKGFQLLEYAHAVEEHEKRIKELIKEIENSILLTNIKDNFTAEQKQAKKAELEEQLQILNFLLSTNRDKVVVSLDTKKLTWSFEPWNKEKHGFDNAVTLTRDGGDPNIIFSKLQYPITNINGDFYTAYKLISNPKNFEDYIITFGTKEDDCFFPKDSPLEKDHSYRIYPSHIDEKTGLVSEFKLIDPAGIIEIPMTISGLRKYDAIYSVARRDKTDNSRISFRGNFYK